MNYNRVNIRLKIFFIFIFSIVLLKPIIVFGEEVNKERIIRVGYPIQKGLTEQKENGEYIGYTYDYLMELSQYTNWKYEFIQVEGDLNTQISTLINMLIEGKIDLMGGMMFQDSLAELMDYSGYNYGTASSALCVLKENEKINSFNYSSFSTLRVAVLENATTYNKKLDQFSQMNGLKIKKVFCDSDEEQEETLKEGRADAMLAIDVSLPSDNLRTIAKFSPESFYFCISKGKKEIVNELNLSITRINESNPYFTISLYEKYFGEDTQQLYLSEAENTYIKQKNKLKIAMIGETAPIQYKNEQGVIKGVSKDILDYISKHTGLQFEIIWTNSSQECTKLIKERKVDLIAGIPADYETVEYREYYTLSIPYMYSPLAVAVNKKVNLTELNKKRLALLKEDEYLVREYKGEKIYFDTIQKCLDALNQGKVDYCYGSSYSIQYYINNNGYKNIITLPQSENQLQRICFGIIQPTNINLISIINKTIQSISEEELQNFLYQNAFQTEKITLFDYIKTNPEQAVLFSLVIIMVFTIILLFWNSYNYRKNNEKIKLESQRYEQISEISNEFLYEYNILQDTLKVSEKCADFLGCQKIIKNLSVEIKCLINKGCKDKQTLFEYIISVKEGNEELLCSLPDGIHWLRVISKNILDINKIPIYSVGKIVDIQQEKEKQKQLLDKSQKDSLTNVYNAATSRQMITQSLNNLEYNNPGAFFIIDVDHFKQVNDNYGHYTGDLVLVELANVLKNIFQEDIVGRLGGDEFIVFMKNITDRNIVIEKCNLLCNQVKEIMVLEQKNLISISVGVAITKINQDYNELYKTADQALYTVKKHGRNGFELI